MRGGFLLEGRPFLRSLFQKLLLGPVDEENTLCGTGDSGVEPAEIVRGEEFFGHVALVDEDIGPLAALGFVAGDGIGILDL